MSWDELDAAWRSAFGSMWEAYAAGTIPVGAALADESGAVVATGRNRRDTASHPLVFEGPLPGPCGLLPELLHVAHFLWRRPDGNVAGFYSEQRPERAAAARRLLERGLMPRTSRLPPLVDVLDSLA